MYGHFGQGCVHMRLSLRPREREGILDFRKFIDEAADIAIAHGGSLSGEHGDGQARGALLPKMFGPELMDAFREFKPLWDPDNELNPDKMIDPGTRSHEDLRLGADYAPGSPRRTSPSPKTMVRFARATLRCVGVGACRKAGRRNHVSQLYGHRGRAALHSRPRPSAVGADAARGPPRRLGERAG